MIQFTKTDTGFLVVFTENELYLDNGTVSMPFNSLSLTVDESDIATFRKAVNGDVFFSGLIDNVTFDGDSVDKDSIAEAFAECCLAETGGGSGLEERVTALETTVGDENSGLVKDVDDLADEVEENGRVTSEALTSLRSTIYDNERVTSEALTELRALNDGKQETLVSGTNIKTVNGQSLLGSGDVDTGDVLVVTMTKSGTTCTADKSVSEIWQAYYTDKKAVIAVVPDHAGSGEYLLTACDPDADQYWFSSFQSNSCEVIAWNADTDYSYTISEKTFAEYGDVRDEIEKRSEVTSAALTQLRRLIAQLDARLTQAESSVNSLGGRMTQAETDITTLDTVMSAAVNQLS